MQDGNWSLYTDILSLFVLNLGKLEDEEYGDIEDFTVMCDCWASSFLWEGLPQII